MAANIKRFLLYLFAVIVCLAIAVMSFTGVVLHNDVTGRIIFGVVWLAVGIAWIGQYIYLEKKNRD